jgi:hypothetical protein
MDKQIPLKAARRVTGMAQAWLTTILPTMATMAMAAAVVAVVMVVMVVAAMAVRHPRWTLVSLQLVSPRTR